MNKQHFQVNVEMATPACDADCPNLQIDVDGALEQKRVVRCVNDTWCQQLYVGIERNLKNS